MRRIVQLTSNVRSQARGLAWRARQLPDFDFATGSAQRLGALPDLFTGFAIDAKDGDADRLARFARGDAADACDAERVIFLCGARLSAHVTSERALDVGVVDACLGQQIDRGAFVSKPKRYGKKR